LRAVPASVPADAKDKHGNIETVVAVTLLARKKGKYR